MDYLFLGSKFFNIAPFLDLETSRDYPNFLHHAVSVSTAFIPFFPYTFF